MLVWFTYEECWFISWTKLDELIVITCESFFENANPTWSYCGFNLLISCENWLIRLLDIFNWCCKSMPFIYPWFEFYNLSDWFIIARLPERNSQWSLTDSLNIQRLSLIDFYTYLFTFYFALHSDFMTPLLYFFLRSIIF